MHKGGDSTALEHARASQLISGMAMLLFGTLAVVEAVAMVFEIEVEAIPFIGWAIGTVNLLLEGGLVAGYEIAKHVHRHAKENVRRLSQGQEALSLSLEGIPLRRSN